MDHAVFAKICIIHCAFYSKKCILQCALLVFWSNNTHNYLAKIAETEQSSPIWKR